MKMTTLLLALLSAVLLPLALPNDIYIYGNPLLGFICLAPFFAAIVMAPSFKFASLLGIVFGGLSTLLVHYWLLFYGEYSLWTVSGVVLGYMGYHALLAPILFGLSRLYPSYRGFLVASTWALYEYLKSSGFLAFPWGLLPHSFNTVLPLVQFIDITGLWGLSLFAALVNTFLAECILLPYHLYRRKVSFLVRNLSFLFFIGILVVSYGFYRLNKPMAEQGRLKVLMVQHNENPWETGKVEDAILRAQNLTLSGLRKGDPDIIVWSETAIKYYIREEQFARVMERIPRLRPLGPFIRETGKYFLIGAPFRPLGTPGYQNAALFISPGAELLGSYGKQQLVPIAEVVPFWDIGFVRTFFKQVLGLTQGWSRGTETTLFQVPIQTGGSLTFGTPICFE
ncbi:MAG TPA: apolipoprotein N-acyltransferase, partial [Spirochaetia bacterium]|nr:apolipoprotein N-acyltransferase [Spirochaetia bacterium]